MGSVLYGDVWDLAYDVAECADCRSEDMGCAVVGGYETIIDMANIILKETDYDLVFCEIGPPDLDGYDDAFIMSLVDNEMMIEKAYNPNFQKYFRIEAGKIFVEYEYLEEFLESNDGDDIVIFAVEEKDEDGKE